MTKCNCHCHKPKGAISTRCMTTRQHSRIKRALADLVDTFYEIGNNEVS